MAHRRIQKIQFILDTKLFKLGTCRRIHLRSFTSEAHINIVHVLHQVNGLLFADIFKQGSAKIIRYIVFAVGKSARSSKSAHNGTGFAVNAAFNLFSVDRAAAVFQRVPGFKYGDLHSLLLRN